MEIDLKNLSNLLSGKLIGNKIVLLEEVDSTNIYAGELARKGEPEGVMVIAETQTAGRGRLGRNWQSPRGINLYASLILRPDVNLSEVPRITLAAGIAVAETLMIFCPNGVRLKWPNDVQIKGRKICGILTEMKHSGNRPEYVVVGIGVNLNMDRQDFIEELRGKGTSLREETGTTVDRTDFILRLCERFERWYTIFLSADFSVIRERWLKLSEMAGKEVRIAFLDHAEDARVIGLGENGALLILDKSHQIREILAGDVSLREVDQ